MSFGSYLPKHPSSKQHLNDPRDWQILRYFSSIVLHSLNLTCKAGGHKCTQKYLCSKHRPKWEELSLSLSLSQNKDKTKNMIFSLTMIHSFSFTIQTNHRFTLKKKKKRVWWKLLAYILREIIISAVGVFVKNLFYESFDIIFMENEKNYQNINHFFCFPIKTFFN